MRKPVLFMLVFLLAGTSVVLAAGTESLPTGYGGNPGESVTYLPVEPLQLAGYGFAGVLAIILISHALHLNRNNTYKKALFATIAVAIAGITLYAAGTTLYFNLISFSQGPVHWHADFEIHVCGQKITNLVESTFPSNKVGTETLHMHNDYRIHQEGLVINPADASLGRFFRVIGGQLTQESMTIPLNDGSTATYTNGMTCPDGTMGTLHAYHMNNQTAGQLVPISNIPGFLMAPYFNTVLEGGQGDFIVIVFDGSGGVPNGS